MTTKTEVPNTTTALDAPEIIFPAEGDFVPSGAFHMTGKATSGNVVRVYTVQDPLNPLFGQLTANDNEWRHSLTLTKAQYRVFAIQSTPDGTETSAASPIRTFWVR